MQKCKRISFYLSHKQWLDLQIICALTEKSMSDFIRASIQHKINTVKLNEDELKIL